MATASYSAMSDPSYWEPHAYSSSPNAPGGAYWGSDNAYHWPTPAPRRRSSFSGPSCSTATGSVLPPGWGAQTPQASRAFSTPPPSRRTTMSGASGPRSFRNDDDIIGNTGSTGLPMMSGGLGPGDRPLNFDFDDLVYDVETSRRRSSPRTISIPMVSHAETSQLSDPYSVYKIASGRTYVSPTLPDRYWNGADLTDEAITAITCRPKEEVADHVDDEVFDNPAYSARAYDAVSREAWDELRHLVGEVRGNRGSSDGSIT